MPDEAKRISILMADDDPDDRMLAEEAFRENELADGLKFVEDGEQLMDYLHRRGRYADPAMTPRPDLILLDLNMPRKDGREVLSEIKQDPDLRRIPVVILTTSRDAEDVARAYDLGGNSFITKPVSFEGLARLVGVLSQYWLEVVELPRT